MIFRCIQVPISFLCCVNLCYIIYDDTFMSLIFVIDTDNAATWVLVWYI